MNTRLIIFILFYNLIIGGMFVGSQKDPSSSLGLRFAIVGVWIISLVGLFLLVKAKTITLKTWLDKVGIFFVTPIPAMIVVNIIATGYEPVSTYEFNRDGHRYKIKTYSYKSLKTKRVEIYKSADTISTFSPLPKNASWLKDSSWFIFSKDGDTVQRKFYRNDTLIENYGG